MRRLLVVGLGIAAVAAAQVKTHDIHPEYRRIKAPRPPKDWEHREYKRPRK